MVPSHWGTVVGPKRSTRATTAILALTVIVLVADILSGPFIQFPILFVFPVVAAVLWHGAGLGITAAVLLPAARAALEVHHDAPLAVTLANATIRIAVLALLAHLVRRAAERQELAARVRVLQGLLPICGFCKQIRNEHGQWERLEPYIAKRSEADFSHGVCPSCARKHYGIDLDG